MISVKNGFLFSLFTISLIIAGTLIGADYKMNGGNSMNEHRGKVAFITGANRGIGFETARELGEKGIIVILGSRDETKGEAGAAKLIAEGISAVAFPFDVNRLADHQRIFEFIDSNYGKLDILINNAGIIRDTKSAAGIHQPSLTSQDVLRETYDTNFFSPVALTQTLLPLIRKSPAGRIVNVTSIQGSLTLHSDPESPIYKSKLFAYSASKAALNAFTIHLAKELKDTKIKVNSAHPGWVKSDMGGPSAPIDLAEGGKTSVTLALLPDDGPSGSFFHLGESLPW